MNYLVALCLSLAPGQPAAPVEYAGRPLKFWLDELASDSLLRKEEALAVLAQIGAPAKDALPHVEKLLRAKESTLRKRAALAVWKLGGTGKHLAEIYADDLKAEDQLVRLEAIRQIQLMGPAAAPALPAILGANPELMKPYFRSLVHGMGKDVLPGLLEALASDNPAAGAAAATLFSFAGPDAAKNAVAALEERLKADDATARVRAAWALWQLGKGGEREIAVFIADLERGAAELRVPIVGVLTGLSPRRKELLAVYKLGLKEKEGGLRVLAASAVWELTKDADAVVPTLVEVLTANSDTATSWRHAVQLLITIGPAGKKALPALMARFKGMDGERYPPTGAALIAVGGADLLDPLFELVAIPRSAPLAQDPHVQERAAMALRILGEPALKAAITRLADKNPEVRRAGCEVLALFGPEAKTAAPRIGELLEDENHWTRRAAGDALRALGLEARAAEKHLIAAAGSKNVETRAVAYKLLAIIGTDKKTMTEIALRGLEESLSDVRGRAIVLLAKADPKHPEIEKAVRKLLAEPNSPNWAAHTIGQLGASGKAFVPDLVKLLNTTASVAAFVYIPAILSPDGKTLAVTQPNSPGVGGNLALWDVEKGKELATAVRGSVQVGGTIRFSADGRLLSVRSGSDTAQELILGALSGLELRKIPSRRSNVAAVSDISPDGRRALLVTPGSSRIRLYDIETEREVLDEMEIGVHASALLWLADGRMAAVDGDGRAGARGRNGETDRPGEVARCEGASRAGGSYRRREGTDLGHDRRGRAPVGTGPSREGSRRGGTDEVHRCTSPTATALAAGPLPERSILRVQLQLRSLVAPQSDGQLGVGTAPRRRVWQGERV